MVINRGVPMESILITGGTKRLGFELAKKSLSMGYSAILHYHSDARDAHQWLEQHTEFKGRMHFVQAELADQPEKLIADVCRLHSPLVGLINNASVFSPGDLSDPGHFSTMLRINALVPVALAQAFHAHAGKGWIINMTDSHTAGRNITYQNYRISKRFLDEMTKHLAFSFAPAIRVNAIAPGAMLPAPGRTTEEFRALAEMIPMKTTGDMAGLLKAFEYLVANTAVTGQILYVDGGWHLT